MAKEKQVIFSADANLLRIIDERRGDVTRSVFLRKTLAIALGVENEVEIDLFHKESPTPTKVTLDAFRKAKLRTEEEVLA